MAQLEYKEADPRDTKTKVSKEVLVENILMESASY